MPEIITPGHPAFSERTAGVKVQRSVQPRKPVLDLEARSWQRIPAGVPVGLQRDPSGADEWVVIFPLAPVWDERIGITLTNVLPRQKVPVRVSGPAKVAWAAPGSTGHDWSKVDFPVGAPITVNNRTIGVYLGRGVVDVQGYQKLAPRHLEQVNRNP